MDIRDGGISGLGNGFIILGEIGVRNVCETSQYSMTKVGSYSDALAGDKASSEQAGLGTIVGRTLPTTNIEYLSKVVKPCLTCPSPVNGHGGAAFPVDLLTHQHYGRTRQVSQDHP